MYIQSVSEQVKLLCARRTGCGPTGISTEVMRVKRCLEISELDQRDLEQKDLQSLLKTF